MEMYSTSLFDCKGENGLKLPMNRDQFAINNDIVRNEIIFQSRKLFQIYNCFEAVVELHSF